MARIDDLQDVRGDLAAKIKALADTQDKWQAEDKATWESLNTDYDENLKAIGDEKKLVEAQAKERDEIKARLDLIAGWKPAEIAAAVNPNAKPATAVSHENAERDRVLSLQSWFRAQSGRDLSSEQRAACERTGMQPGRTELPINLGDTGCIRGAQEDFASVHPSQAKSFAKRNYGQRFQAALSTTTTAGGYTIPEGFVPSLEVNMLAFGGVMQVAEVIRSDGVNPIQWPTATDTGNTGELLAESGSIGSSVDPTFGRLTLDAYKFSSKPILVPVELLEDSAFDLPGVLGAMIGERIGRIANTYFTTGTGSSQPEGIVTGASAGVTAAGAAAITFDEVIDLEFSVDPAYRNGAGYMCADATVLLLRKLKDGNGNYMWLSGAQASTKDSLNGFPLTMNQDMPAATTGLKSLLFGQLSKYKIRQVRQIRMRRLVELYAGNDQEAFIAFVRMDGGLLDAGTAPVNYLIQA